MAPEETRIACLPALARLATSWASELSQAALSWPLARSTSRLEPILTTIRRASLHWGRERDDASGADMPGSAPYARRGLLSSNRDCRHRPATAATGFSGSAA